MALSKDKALECVRQILNGPRAAEQPRLNRIRKALMPLPANELPAIVLPKNPRPQIISLARKAETNYMPLVLDVFGQSMKADGYYSKSSKTMAGPWKYWQRNKWDARQTGTHRATLAYGVAYETVLPGTRGPAWRGVSPRFLTALYQYADDDWAMLALHTDGTLFKLYDEECMYRFGLEPNRETILNPSASAGMLEGRLTYIDTIPHGVDGVPIVRYRDRMLLDGEEQLGVIEPLLSLQDRITETTYEMLVAQFFGAFKQRYVAGWLPESEEEYLKASAAEVWTFEDPDVKAGQFDATDVGGYIQSRSSAIRDLAAIGQLPAQNLGVDAISNISDATLAGLEVSKERKSDEIATSLGESHEQKLQLSAAIDGDQEAAEDYDSEIRWKDTTARAFAAQVDGLSKLGTMLGVPNEMLWEMIPGWTQNMVDRAMEIAASNRLANDPITAMNAMLERQADGGPVPPDDQQA